MAKVVPQFAGVKRRKDHKVAVYGQKLGEASGLLKWEEKKNPLAEQYLGVGGGGGELRNSTSDFAGEVSSTSVQWGKDIIGVRTCHPSDRIVQSSKYGKGSQVDLIPPTFQQQANTV